MRNVVQYNREVWNQQAINNESRWVQPVDEQTIERARGGDWQVILTPNRVVPGHWFGDIRGRSLLCLASGGGQQAPVLAAAGAHVTSFDNSDEQLAKDAQVAARNGLDINVVQGDMADLACFSAGQFELIFHPVSNVFAPDVRSVWHECFRVLDHGGRLLSGFMNPDYYLFDHEEIDAGGALVVSQPLPYSDVGSLDAAAIERRRARGEAMEYSHSLDDQIGGQIAAGFSIAGFYEDRWDDEASPLNAYMPTSMATLALKP